MITASLMPVLYLVVGLYSGAIREHFELMFRNMNEMFDKKPPAFEVERSILLEKRLIEAIDFHIQANG